MPIPINLLIIEDSPADAELLVEALRDADYDPVWRRVETKADYLRELSIPPDVILSDFSLPQFDGRTALMLLKERGLDIPFIIVSGCIGEDVAVECMKSGASDYLLKDRLGRLAHSMAQALDRRRLMAEKRQVEQRLFLESFHDSLTGLPNRALFLDRLDRAVLRHHRDREHLYAVLYVGLDGFKVVHDSLGHVQADRILVHVSQRLLRRVRSVDTLASLGNQEFALLLDNLKSADNAIRIAERIRQEFVTSFELDGREIFLKASIGITSGAQEYERGECVLRDAATAMHRAKGAGEAGFAVFDPAMHEQAMTRLKMETDLRQALERNEFRLHYQPIIALDRGCVAGFEALIRWQHPERGLVMPQAFLPVAAEMGILDMLAERSCAEACRQLAEWQEAFPRVDALSVSVNFTARQLARPDLVAKLRQMVRTTALKPGSLKIEITESEMMEDPKTVSEILQELSAEHIDSCLDDFGTGYSSLSHLQRLPLSFLKVDQSFIRRLSLESDALPMVKTIVVLAHQLGRKVIAEGVESHEQLSILRSLGCEYGQGYLFAPPLPDTDIPALLASGQRW
jgi:diguanylate cyclase (GGDEF)-like protein